MKIRYAILLIMLFTNILSCKNKEDKVVEDIFQATNDGLIGKWKMVEILYDPGDGSGVFHKVSEDLSTIVEFKTNGDFKETRGSLSSYANPFTKYRIVSDGLIELSGASNSASAILNWTYTDLTSTTVTFDFGCKERCAGKFVAIK
ncbi:hypothetical protein LZG74_13300 [Dyadobacter sp. CY327]|uniref:hypothetical protein n=1 Tax=Dyadobacter sp. CY327 TaxID=2907301 RepID=UPI001F39B457|nr:hypothetical protein [Dyadobacter sp. CY327]MCE7071289.1 hypothetical protein [Dyadobacter sp. CY327]